MHGRRIKTVLSSRGSRPKVEPCLNMLEMSDFELKIATTEPKILGLKDTPGAIKLLWDGFCVFHSMECNDAKKQEP